MFTTGQRGQRTVTGETTPVKAITMCSLMGSLSLTPGKRILSTCSIHLVGLLQSPLVSSLPFLKIFNFVFLFSFYYWEFKHQEFNNYSFNFPSVRDKNKILASLAISLWHQILKRRKRQVWLSFFLKKEVLNLFLSKAVMWKMIFEWHMDGHLLIYSLIYYIFKIIFKN